MRVVALDLEDGTVRRRREREARERGIVARAHTWSQRVHEVAGYGVAVGVAVGGRTQPHAHVLSKDEYRLVWSWVTVLECQAAGQYRLELGHAQHLIALVETPRPCLLRLVSSHLVQLATPRKVEHPNCCVN